MFTKKSSIPPRPSPPDANHILEDLLNASSNDSLFTLREKSKPKFSTNKEQTKGTNEDLTLLVKDELKMGSEDVYIKVKNFVETNYSLHNMMHVLQEKNDSLQISDIELKGLAEDIRKQALEALK